jgi:hypothetical protein
MKKGFAWASIALGLAVAFTSCSGRDGIIYGQYYNAGTVYYGSLGGFPSTYITPYTDYRIDEGTYDVFYTLSDGAKYYPGNLFGTGSGDDTWKWHSTYTVTADKGAPFMDGSDKYFELYLGYGGLSKFGDVKAIAGKGLAPKLGAASWTQDGLKITVTNEIVSLSETQKEALRQNLKK